MRFVAFLLLVVSACFSLGQELKQAVYFPVISEEVRELCKKLGVPEPTGRLVLRSDASFLLDSSGKQSSGKYAVGKETLALMFSDGSRPVSLATAFGDRVVLDGIIYERPALRLSPGTWTLRRQGREDVDIRFVFDKSGRFSFSGMGGTSKVAWEVDQDALILTWSEIDGAPVEKSFSVRRRIALRDSSFMIDQYHYRPQGAQ